MKKLIPVIGLLISSLLIANPSLANTAPVQKPAEKLTVILDWFPNPDHAPLIIAKQQGFFKEQGLDVDLIGPADPNDPPKLVAAHKADIGITYEPQFMEQVDQGLPLIRIGTLIDRPLNCLVIAKDSGIKSLADLKGKRIGSTTGGLTSIMLKTMLAKQGVSSRDIELINVRYNLSQALLTHRVDAVTGIMRNVEVPSMEAAGHEVQTYFPEDYGIPNYSELIFISNLSNAHDPRFPKFLAAVRKAVAYLDAHPEATWRQFAKAYPEANNSVNRNAWFDTMPYFAENPADVDNQEWLRFATFMQQNHLIKNIQPISRYVVAVG